MECQSCHRPSGSISTMPTGDTLEEWTLIIFTQSSNGGVYQLGSPNSWMAHHRKSYFRIMIWVGYHCFRKSPIVSECGCKRIDSVTVRFDVCVNQLKAMRASVKSKKPNVPSLSRKETCHESCLCISFFIHLYIYGFYSESRAETQALPLPELNLRPEPIGIPPCHREVWRFVGNLL